MSDEPIRDFFRSVRQRDALRTPSLEATLSPSRPRPRRALWAGVAAAAVSCALAVLIVGLVLEPSPSSTLSEWRSPTEFLLEPPLAVEPPLVGESFEEVFQCESCR